jgi:hypothetical protein
LLPFAAQRDGVGRGEPATAVASQRDLHVVEARSAVVMVLTTVGRAIVSRRRPVIIPAVIVIVAGFVRAMIVRAVEVGLFHRLVRAAQAVPRYAGEEPQLDQQGEDDGAGKTHADGTADYA